MFPLALFQDSKSLSIYRDWKRSVFSKREKTWLYFMELLGDRASKKEFPSGCTDEILLCGVHAYSW